MQPEAVLLREGRNRRQGVHRIGGRGAHGGNDTRRHQSIGAVRGDLTREHRGVHGELVISGDRADTLRGKARHPGPLGDG